MKRSEPPEPYLPYGRHEAKPSAYPKTSPAFSITRSPIAATVAQAVGRIIFQAKVPSRVTLPARLSPLPGPTTSKTVQFKSAVPFALLLNTRILQAAAAAPVRKSARIAAQGVRPAPQHIDKYGQHFWNGFRGGLSWNAITNGLMAPLKAGGCQVQTAICTGNADGIDHIQDFATVSAGLATETYCDGNHHWEGVPLVDAKAAYNDTNNLQWSCTKCNSSKSGARGMYTPVTYVEDCPGATCPL